MIIFFMFYSLTACAESVYRLNPIVDVSVITASTLGTVIPYAMDAKLITPRCPCDRGEVNSFDRGVIGNSNQAANTASDVSVGLALTAPILLDWLELGTSSTFAEDLVVYSEVLSLSGALTTLAKFTVQRPIPRTYDSHETNIVSNPSSYRSFYSGHTALTFSALSAASLTSNLRHQSGIFPWIITVIFGTSVAVERVAAGKHFYTDVIVGALAGTAIGITIPLLHRNENAEQSLGFAPTADGFQLLWNRFF